MCLLRKTKYKDRYLKIYIDKKLYLAANDMAIGKIPIVLPPQRYSMVELADPFHAW